MTGRVGRVTPEQVQRLTTLVEALDVATRSAAAATDDHAVSWTTPPGAGRAVLALDDVTAAITGLRLDTDTAGRLVALIRALDAAARRYGHDGSLAVRDRWVTTRGRLIVAVHALGGAS